MDSPFALVRQMKYKYLHRYLMVFAKFALVNQIVFVPHIISCTKLGHEPPPIQIAITFSAIFGSVK